MAEEKETRIDVKQAVRAAMNFIREVYSEEKITNVGLEEVDSEEDTWLVTIGFSRPWDFPRIQRSALDIASSLIPRPDPSPTRDYKVVKIDSKTGEIQGMEIREE